MTVSEERPRLLVLDLLESYARERDIHVVLARMTTSDEWICRLTDTAGQRVVRGPGKRRGRRSWMPFARKASKSRARGIVGPAPRHVAPRCRSAPRLRDCRALSGSYGEV